MKGDALKGHLDLLLLAILADGPAHGYAVIEQLRRRSEDVFDLAEGTVYPALHRLERSGLVGSRWDEAAPRRRRVYELSDQGSRKLEQRRHEWRGFQSAVNAVVSGVS